MINWIRKYILREQLVMQFVLTRDKNLKDYLPNIVGGDVPTIIYITKDLE